MTSQARKTSSLPTWLPQGGPLTRCSHPSSMRTPHRYSHPSSMRTPHKCSHPSSMRTPHRYSHPHPGRTPGEPSVSHFLEPESHEERGLEVQGCGVFCLAG